MGDVAVAIDKNTTGGAQHVTTAGGVEVVELLVPGLGLVDREALLRPDGLRRTTGDKKAGFHRAEQARPSAEAAPGGRRLVTEVYDWTRLTIGGASRALWMRRNAGLAWAFGAFWPRAVHPFAPPPWTVRAVPEPVRRLQYLLRDGHRLVLIRAGSMGSVLARAAIWQLRAEQRERIALLTSGCPVRTCFSPLYPGFMCVDSVHWPAPCGAEQELVAWTNVWRDTDPIGGPVGISCVDTRWTDPEERWDATGALCLRSRKQPVFPPVEGHGGYTTDRKTVRLRDELLDRLLRARAVKRG